MHHDEHYPDFMKALLKAFVGFGTFSPSADPKVIKGRIDYYWEMLEDVKWEDFEQGFRVACQHATKGFPYPGTIREYTDQAREHRVARLGQTRWRELPPGRDPQEEREALAHIHDIIAKLSADKDMNAVH